MMNYNYMELTEQEKAEHNAFYAHLISVELALSLYEHDHLNNTPVSGDHLRRRWVRASIWDVLKGEGGGQDDDA